MLSCFSLHSQLLPTLSAFFSCQKIMKELPLPSLMAKYLLHWDLSLQSICAGSHGGTLQSAIIHPWLSSTICTVIMELFAGTNSFGGGISAFGKFMFHAERWRGEKFRRRIMEFNFLVVAAFNEWRYIWYRPWYRPHRLTGGYSAHSHSSKFAYGNLTYPQWNAQARLEKE